MENVIVVLGFVLGIVGLLGVAPALERWATAPPTPATPEGRKVVTGR